MVRVGSACGGALMAWLSPILENVTHEYVPGCGVRTAVIALVSVARPQGATNYTHCSINLSWQSYTFSASNSCAPWDHCLNRQCGQAGVRTALSASEKPSLMMRPLLGGSLGIGHRHRGSVCVIGLHCWGVCKL